MQQLPIAPPWASEHLKREAFAAAEKAYLYVFAQEQANRHKFAYPIVSTAHLPIAQTLKGNALKALLIKAGFVHVGRCRFPGGYTTMYVQKELRNVYASPTDAYKAFWA